MILIDVWTQGHMMVGAVYALLHLRWFTALGLMCGWEVFEHVLPNDVFYDPDIYNSLADILFALATYAVCGAVLLYRDHDDAATEGRG